MDDPSLLIDGRPDDPTLVLAHGAGAGMDSDWMESVASGLAERGLRIVRFEFPYMRRRRESGGRRPPDRAAVLESSWREVVERLGGGDGLAIGGKSMGGRIASRVADGLGVAALVCYGYPFHPPGRPGKTRTAHLADLRTPTLLLQGERDPFGKPEEIAGYDLSDAIRVHWLVDGDHSLKPRVKSGRTLEENLAEAMDATASFVTSL